MLEKWGIFGKHGALESLYGIYLQRELKLKVEYELY